MTNKEIADDYVSKNPRERKDGETTLGKVKLKIDDLNDPRGGLILVDGIPIGAIGKFIYQIGEYGMRKLTLEIHNPEIEINNLPLHNVASIESDIQSVVPKFIVKSVYSSQ